MSIDNITRNTKGIGGSTPEQALACLSDMTAGAAKIELADYQARIAKAQAYLRANDIAALYINSGTNLSYFTGINWGVSERLMGAVLLASGEVYYLAPAFEIDTIKQRLLVDGEILGWHEHESPYALLIDSLNKRGISSGKLALDESTQFFMVDGIQQQAGELSIINGFNVTAHCRMHKEAKEIALIKQAMQMTLEVHKAAASILHEGITTAEVEEFIEQAHRKVGASGSYFCIVLFGKATSYPHGVEYVQTLKAGDMVLIDTGCKLKGYHSDITRSYVFGDATEKQQQIWLAEKNAQLAAFAAAKLGEPCGSVDDAARASLQADGLGPDYDLPGLPHRTGHGLGMDIHEAPYLVRGNQIPLETGMVFSNEPMIVVPEEFGVRLEDHFYMGETGPEWFTEPSHSIDNPFGD
ncbi:X-Pro dipeptidase [Shewanella mangrovi]|uniref:X-Pro dipeptidase n=1 Tax=Shewanella mangrovi TaxID=1515746 RepID=A0A094JZ94_9GAMM|nr:Xaa-Pro peptidase family protein [Shewanella mangrovi]KFZ37756.1 X-Pro dipeptidase [Shewanella mangrovi]